MSSSDRVDQLDASLFDEIPSGGTSSADRRSLLAVHAAVASRGDFAYLEVGSFLGASLQSFITDPRCHSIVSIDRRDEVSQDARSDLPEYPDNTTTHMLARLSRVPGADLSKLTTIDASTPELNPTDLNADLCFIDAEHTDVAVLRDARFCRQVVRERGVILFHDRTLVDHGIRQFLRELPRCRAYPLSHELLVVEINVPSLLADSRVKGQVPRRLWVGAYRLGAVPQALSLGAVARRFEAICGRSLLALGAPRRSRRNRDNDEKSSEKALFEIYTFVTDDQVYERMWTAFIRAGFSPNAFVRLTDCNDDPYAAITRIGRKSPARYPILCHQDVRPDRGHGAVEFRDALTQLDTIDPGWAVAGTAGVMRSGRGVRRLVDLGGGPTNESPESLPLPVVMLDENFLVFNRRNGPRCSGGMSGFHLYGADVCLNALSSGGAAYVIDFPVTHLGRGDVDSSFETAKSQFIETWSERFLLCYLVTPITTLCISRSKVLRRLFGSALAMTCIGQAVRSAEVRSESRPSLDVRARSTEN
jgi:Methyltransferase domain